MNRIVIKEHTLIEDLLKNKSLTVIDLGSCLGEFISELNNKFNIEKSILVEANPTNFEKLPKNNKFISLNKAVYIESNKILLFKEDTSSPYNGSAVLNHFPNTAKEHKISTISLKDLINLMDVKGNIDILKIDIEGCEYPVLENISDEDILKFNQVTVEFHDFFEPSFKSKNLIIESRFKQLGFSVIKNRNEYKNGSDYYDTLFYKN
jgi:FkbM family methyltransferase